MDKKSVIAIVLITVVILLLPEYYKLINDQPERTVSYKPQHIDSTTVPPKSESEKVSVVKESVKQESAPTETKPVKNDVVEAKDIAEIVINTPLINAKLSSMGGGNISHWDLINYDTWQGNKVNIINEQIRNGFLINFITMNGDAINLNDYIFYPEMEYPASISLTAGQSKKLTFSLEIGNAKIYKSLTIYADHYHIDVELKIENASGLLLNNEYQVGWVNGLPSNEENRSEDYTYSEAYASMGDELENFTIDSEGKVDKVTLNGKTAWAGVRTKYFLAAVIPGDATTSGVNFGGYGETINEIVERRYLAQINITKTDPSSDSYSVYMGPLDHAILSEYENGLDDLIMSHGWYERTFRAISLPIVGLLKFFHTFIPNYGIVIIIFSVLVKILVYPLTKKSYKSMKEMSKVQPLMAEMKEKYKNDPQRLNKETMKLYKEHGINPLGGCLPMLLQLPLLGALFIVFRSTIQLRGASFIPGWIDDLSRADTIFTLPFSLPMYGDQFNILPILMAGSMIFQSKMTMQDPKQKAMVYIMPIFMLLIFNQFPSGLNLYYTLFNVLTIIQQKITDNNGAQKAEVKK